LAPSCVTAHPSKTNRRAPRRPPTLLDEQYDMTRVSSLSFWGRSYPLQRLVVGKFAAVRRADMGWVLTTNVFPGPSRIWPANPEKIAPMRGADSLQLQLHASAIVANALSALGQRKTRPVSPSIPRRHRTSALSACPGRTLSLPDERRRWRRSSGYGDARAGAFLDRPYVTPSSSLQRKTHHRLPCRVQSTIGSAGFSSVYASLGAGRMRKPAFTWNRASIVRRRHLDGLSARTFAPRQDRTNWCAGR